MTNNKQVAEGLLPLQQQFEQFRATHPPRSKLPEALWQSAAALAKQHGLYPVAHALRLDYTGLKKRLGGAARRRRKATPPRFVELIAPGATKLDECVIEFESAHGAKMRIQWKATGPLDWASLLRTWRAAENDSDHSADARAGGDRACRRA